MDSIFYAKAAAFFGAALAIGIGSIGPAIGQALVAMKACENIGKNPEGANDIRKTMLIGMGIIETALIYLVLIAAALLWIGYTI